jgi:hypothetical protein
VSADNLEVVRQRNRNFEIRGKLVRDALKLTGTQMPRQLHCEVRQFTNADLDRSEDRGESDTDQACSPELRRKPHRAGA